MSNQHFNPDSSGVFAESAHRLFISAISFKILKLIDKTDLIWTDLRISSGYYPPDFIHWSLSEKIGYQIDAINRGIQWIPCFVKRHLRNTFEEPNEAHELPIKRHFLTRFQKDFSRFFKFPKEALRRAKWLKGFKLCFFKPKLSS